MSARTFLRFSALACAITTSTVASGQTLTLEDLAALQRTAIESDARRAASRAEAPPTPGGTVVPAPALAVIPSTPVPVAATPNRPGTYRLPAPRMAVAGVAGARGLWIVELTTDNGPLLLQAGDLVPGTNWRVVGVSARSVRLERSTASRSGRVVRKTQRVLEPGDPGPSGDD